MPKSMTLTEAIPIGFTVPHQQHRAVQWAFRYRHSARSQLRETLADSFLPGTGYHAGWARIKDTSLGSQSPAASRTGVRYNGEERALRICAS